MLDTTVAVKEELVGMLKRTFIHHTEVGGAKKVNRDGIARGV